VPDAALYAKRHWPAAGSSSPRDVELPVERGHGVIAFFAEEGDDDPGLDVPPSGCAVNELWPPTRCHPATYTQLLSSGARPASGGKGGTVNKKGWLEDGGQRARRADKVDLLHGLLLRRRVQRPLSTERPKQDKAEFTTAAAA